MSENKIKNHNNKLSIVDILKSEIRFRIFSLFNMFPELNLAKLKELTGKSKSTLHHHLEKLINADLIYLSREEKVRGNIPSKYYSLKPGYTKKLNATDSELHKADNSLTEFYKTYLNSAIRTLELYKKFFEKCELEEEGLEQLQAFLEESEGFSSMLYFSEDQFKRVVKIYGKFRDEINKIEAEGNDLKMEKPFYVFTLGILLKPIIEEKSILPNVQK